MQISALVKKFLLLLFTLSFTIAPLTAFQAYGTNYVKVEGILTNYKGEHLAAPTYINARVQGQPAASVTVGKLGYYELFIQPSEKVELTIVVLQGPYNSATGPQEPFDDVVFSNWSTTLKVERDSVVNFQLPKPIKVKVSIVDAQDQPVPNSWMVESNGNPPHNPITDFSGLTWKGIQRWNGSTVRFISQTGQFTFYYYPTDSFDGVNYGLSKTPSYFSGAFPLLKETEIKICLPINFGASRTMPENCYNEIWAAAKAIADSKKFKAEYEPLAKSLEEYKVKISAWFVAHPEIWSANQTLRDNLQRGLDFKIVENPTEADLREINSLLTGSKVTQNGLILNFRRGETLVNQKNQAARIAAESAQKAELVKKKIDESKKRVSITCFKGGTTLKVTALSPKCPKGYTKK